MKIIGTVNPLLSDEYIEKMGKFFEWNALYERFGWNFEWFLKQCAEGKAPTIPSYNWKPKSKIDTFDTNNEQYLNIS